VVIDVATPSAEVEQVVRRWGQVEATGPATSTLRMNVDSLDWPAMVLGALGADFTVRAPDELAAHLRRMGERFTRATA
jgi:predicted DNA-binding transcriptional regulator YafY